MTRTKAQDVTGTPPPPVSYLAPQPGFTRCPYCKALCLAGNRGLGLLTPLLGERHMCTQRQTEEESRV